MNGLARVMFLSNGAIPSRQRHRNGPCTLPILISFIMTQIQTAEKILLWTLVVEWPQKVFSTVSVTTKWWYACSICFNHCISNSPCTWLIICFTGWVDAEAGKTYPGNGHLTAVLWRASHWVGCGEASRGNRHYQVCRYYIPGEFVYLSIWSYYTSQYHNHSQFTPFNISLWYFLFPIGNCGISKGSKNYSKMLQSSSGCK